MVRSADRRIAKYKAKMDGDVLKNRYDATKDISVTSEENYAPCAQVLEETIKTDIDGTPAILLPYYIIFGKQVQKALENHEAITAQMEIDTFHDIWEMRGLVDATLDIVEASVKGLAPCP